MPIKAMQHIKQNGDCSTEAGNFELDKMAELFDRVSPAVDDFAAVIYPPVDKEEFHKEVSVYLIK